jgi:transposase
VRIYFATGLVDMRNGVDGLRTIVEQVLKRNPNDGHLFVFIGKRRDMLKILFWDKNGYVVYFKRLERGRFQLPVVDEKRVKVEMEAAQLATRSDSRAGIRPRGSTADPDRDPTGRWSCLPSIMTARSATSSSR